MVFPSFPVVVLVFDFDEFSEGVLHGHSLQSSLKESASIDNFKRDYKMYLLEQ
jgi:hypothetical protein